jgi:hypothetical protein
MGGAMKAYKNPYTAYINGTDVTDFGAIVQSYKVGGTPVSHDFYQARNRAAITSLGYTLGVKQITLVLFLAAPTQRELATQKSALDAALLTDPLELHLPDGFYYKALLQSAGDLAMQGIEANKVIASCTYALQGLRHDEMQTVDGPDVLAEGTYPQMPCILRCTASRDYDELQLGPVTFSDIEDGDELVADGIAGLLTINGEPAGIRATFTRLPRLVPGPQTVSCPEPVTVSYCPGWL